MTQEQQLNHFKLLNEKLLEIMTRKGSDYAGADRLSNFKLGAQLTGISPAQNCLSLLATKVARIGNLLQEGKTIENESLLDSVEDLINYGHLLHMVLSETINWEFTPGLLSNK